MKYTLEKINKWLIVTLVLIQPIINIFRNIFINDIQFLGFSIFEMTNIFLVFLSSVITIYLYKDKKKFLKYMIFLILFAIYSVCHYANILRFKSEVYENYNPSFLSETYYLFRTFVISLLLILNIYYSNIKKQTIIRVIEVLSLIISLVIVISNLFKIGLLSYGEGICRQNIFDWFTFKSTHAYSYYQITCKGWFSSANQISSILFMTLPIILYLAYRKKCLFNYIVLILHSLAMFMLGTKTANLGVILVYSFFILFYFILKLFKKTNHSIFVITMIFSFLILLLLYSPYYHNISYNSNRATTFEKIEENEDNIDDIDNQELVEGFSLFKKIKKYDCDNLSKIEQANVIKLYKKHKSYLGISNYILTNYKVEKHPGFWCSYIVNYSSNDYRDLKTNILKNIYTENNNSLDKYFGLGYSLNYIYTESDYSYQYYIYGIFGILLFILPYFIILGFLGFSIIKNFNKKFNLENCMYMLGPILSLTIAYYSGHVLERTFPLLIMALLVGLNLIKLKKDDSIPEKVMIVSDCSDGKINPCLKKILKHYDYRVVISKETNIQEFKKLHGKKADYFISQSKNNVINFFVYIYNLCKFIVLYLKFNPNSVISTTKDMSKTIVYISDFFGSKNIVITPFVDTDKFSSRIQKKVYSLNYNETNKNKLEKQIVNIVNSPKKTLTKDCKYRFLIIVFITFLTIFMLSPLTGDDWGNAINGYNKSLWNSILYAKKCFFDYEGRFFSRVLLIYLMNKKLLCSIISAIAMSSIYFFATKFDVKKKSNILFPMSFIALMLIDIEAFNQGIQWTTGRITYLFPIAYIFPLLYITLNKKFISNNFIFIPLVLLTFIFSMFVETISCGMVIILATTLIFSAIKYHKLHFKLLILTMVSIIGLLLMRYSPGSLNRLSTYAEFDKSPLYEKVILNIPNLIKYTLMNNIFILLLLAIICPIIINKRVKNSIIKVLLVIYTTIMPVLTALIYGLKGLEIKLLPELININNHWILWYWITFSVIALIIIFRYLLKKHNKFILILFIGSIGSNICMLVSPIWGGRTSLFTDIGISITLIYIFIWLIKPKYEKRIYYGSIIILSLLLIFNLNGYLSLRSDNTKREDRIKDQLMAGNTKTIDIYKLSSRFSWNPNPYQDGYLSKTIKMYYNIPKDYKIRLVDR